MIELDVAGPAPAPGRVRRRNWRRRRAAWKAPAPAAEGGYARLYIEHVQQADTGADLDFLVGCRGIVVTRESH